MVMIVRTMLRGFIARVRVRRALLNTPGRPCRCCRAAPGRARAVRGRQSAGRRHVPPDPAAARHGCALRLCHGPGEPRAAPARACATWRRRSGSCSRPGLRGAVVGQGARTPSATSSCASGCQCRCRPAAGDMDLLVAPAAATVAKPGERRRGGAAGGAVRRAPWGATGRRRRRGARSRHPRPGAPGSCTATSLRAGRRDGRDVPPGDGARGHLRGAVPGPGPDGAGRSAVVCDLGPREVLAMRDKDIGAAALALQQRMNREADTSIRSVRATSTASRRSARPPSTPSSRARPRAGAHDGAHHVRVHLRALHPGAAGRGRDHPGVPPPRLRDGPASA